MQPTPRALALLPVVQQALALLREGLAPPAVFSPDESTRRFTLATTDYFEEVMYPPFLSQLLAYAPGISFSIELITPDVLSEGLEQRHVDMVVGLDSQSALPSGVIQTPWMDEELVCLAATHNKRIGEALDIVQFARERHVELTDISGLRPSNIDSCLVQHGLTRHVISKNLNYIAAARVVALTEAVMTLPRQMAERFVDMLPVRLVEPPQELPAFKNDPDPAWALCQRSGHCLALSAAYDVCSGIQPPAFCGLIKEILAFNVVLTRLKTVERKLAVSNDAMP